jgi:hypothetical protein
MTGGLSSTKTACDIASQFASGLFQPIAAQIDPYRLADSFNTAGCVKRDKAVMISPAAAEQ